MHLNPGTSFKFDFTHAVGARLAKGEVLPFKVRPRAAEARQRADEAERKATAANERFDRFRQKRIADAREAAARAALRAFVGFGEVEAWVAGRPWKAVAGGWTVAGELQGWRYRVEPAPGRVRVFASPGGSEPAVWFVLGWG